MSEINIQETIKQADAQLRQSERQMFSGKKDEALNLFKEARELYNRAKEADPANPQLKILEPKIIKAQKDLERRIGKPIDGESPQTQPAAAATPEPVKTEPPKSPSKVNLPYNARKPMQDAQNQLRMLENNFKQLTGADNQVAKSLISRIENNISEGKKMLQESLDEAKKGGVTNHPDLEKIAADLADAESRFAQARAKVADQLSGSAARSEEVNADCDALRKEYDRLRPTLDKCGIPYYNDLEPLKEQIRFIEEFEKNELQGVKEKLTAFEQKYGTTRDEIKQKTDEAGYSGVTNATEGWVWLSEGTRKIPETRVYTADDLIDRMETQLPGLINKSDFHRLQNHAVLREWLEMAKRYNSESSKVIEMAQTLETKLKADAEAFSASIDKRTWPGNSTGAIAEAALKYFNESPDWAKNPKPQKILGVAIHGDWSVQERDILGTPIMYGIPVYAAIMMGEEEGENLARVFDVTMRTGEGTGVKAEPPFFSLTVGSSYYIRADKVK